MKSNAAGAPPIDGAKRKKREDVKRGGVVILPAMPAGSTVRVVDCGRAGATLEIESADASVYLWVTDRRDLAVSLENRAVAG